MKKKIFITGINGVTGYYLYNLLNDSSNSSDSYELYGNYIEDNPLLPLSEFKKATLFKVDILDEEGLAEIIKEVGADEIYHLAAMVPVFLVNKNIWKAFEVNVRGTINLLNAVKTHTPKARVLIVGSSNEYGAFDRDLIPIKEEPRFSPVDYYGVTKVAQELMGLQYYRYYDLDIVFTRTFNYMGQRQPEYFATASFVREVLQTVKSSEERVIKVGNLDVTRDFLDVRDVVVAYQCLMQKGKAGECYNVCSGEGVNLQEMLALIIKKIIPDQEVSVIIDKEKFRKSDNPYLIGDNTKLSALGFKPTYQLSSSLDDIIVFWMKDMENKEG